MIAAVVVVNIIVMQGGGEGLFGCSSASLDQLDLYNNNYLYYKSSCHPLIIEILAPEIVCLRVNLNQVL